MPKPYAQLRAQISPDAQRQAEATARELLDADTAAVARLAYEASQASLAWVAPYYPGILCPWPALPAFTRHAWKIAVQTVRQHDQGQATREELNADNGRLAARGLEDAP